MAAKKDIIEREFPDAMVVRPPIEGATMIEGYLWAMARRSVVYSSTMSRSRSNRKMAYSIDIYTERLLAALVYAVQGQLEGVDPSTGIDVHPSPTLQRYREIVMPISLLTSGERDRHYRYAVESIKLLQSIVIEFPKADRLSLRNFIVDADIMRNTGRFHFSVSPEIWDAIASFSSGYRRTEFNMVRRLHRPVSYRFYKLVAGQDRPLKYSIDELCDMFGISDSYRVAWKFQKHYLEKCREELDRVSPWSFDYTLDSSAAARSSSARGRMPKDQVVITARYIPANDPDNQYREVVDSLSSVASVLSPESLSLLLNQKDFGFTTDGLNSHMKLVMACNASLGSEGFHRYLRETLDMARQGNADNPAGILVWRMKSLMESVADGQGRRSSRVPSSVPSPSRSGGSASLGEIISSVRKPSRVKAAPPVASSAAPADNPYLGTGTGLDELCAFRDSNYRLKGKAVPAALDRAIEYLESQEG